MINIPDPELQIDFAAALTKMRALYLQDALSATVGTLDIVSLDQELASYVPKQFQVSSSYSAVTDSPANPALGHHRSHVP